MLFAADHLRDADGLIQVSWAFTDARGDAEPAPADGAAAHPTDPTDPSALAASSDPSASACDPTGVEPLAARYGGFNLGDHVGDDPGAVAANRARLMAELGLTDVVFMNQVHGTTVVQVQRPWRASQPPSADAMVAATDGLGLAVLVADCVPVLLADRLAGVIGVAHAGRAGMVHNVVAETIAAMRDLGAHAIEAIVGPSICGRCYEVPDQMRTQAGAASAFAPAVSWRGTPAIDVGAGVVDQLTQLGAQVTWLPGCTREDQRLYSYRRQHQTGRFAGVIALRRGEAQRRRSAWPVGSRAPR